MNSAENQNSIPDSELMIEIADGNADALSELFDRYGKIVFAVCMRVLKDRVDADEVTSKVFWEVWDRSHRFDVTRGSVQAYVLTIARSRAVDHVRSRNSKSNSSNQVHLDSVPMLAVDGFDPSDQIIADEWRQHVKQAIDSLDAAQREAIELAFYEGLSHREVAERLKKPLGTVKAHIRKGLLKLRHCLAEFEKGRPS